MAMMMMAMVMIMHASQVVTQMVQRFADVAHDAAEVAQGARANLPRPGQPVDYILDVME